MQVRINREAWHYRFLRKLECEIPNDLCTYFWKVVFFLMCVVGATAMAAVAVVVLLSPVLAFFIDLPFIQQSRYLGGLFDLLILVIVWLCYREHTADNREPSIVGEWVKAKKRGICPLIEFV